MKMYLPFGDWSDDGHGKYEKILIDAPSMEHLLEAQKNISAIYGNRFWDEFANEYDEPFIGDKVQRALVDTNYPVARFAHYLDDIKAGKFNSIEELFNSEWWNVEAECYVTLDLAIDAFIYLLNAYGAGITKLEEEEEIPMICNWTCPGFETVGYGCFY